MWVHPKSRKPHFPPLSGVFQFRDSLLRVHLGLGDMGWLGAPWGQGWVPSGGGDPIGLGNSWGLGRVSSGVGDPVEAVLGTPWGQGWVSNSVGDPVGVVLGSLWGQGWVPHDAGELGQNGGRRWV